MQQIELNGLPLLQFSYLNYAQLIHLSSTIVGGVSSGNYSSLNFSELSGDNLTDVISNKLILADALSISSDKIIIPHQTHSANILIIDSDFIVLSKDEQRILLENHDALITNQKNVFIGILTADCVPILIYDPILNILASIHAGWKGTVSHIAAKTALKMISHFGSNVNDLIVGIGPSISANKFEVGDEVGNIFEQSGFDLSDISFRNKNTNKLHIDLWKANLNQLTAIGIPSNHIEVSQLCTYSNPKLFFSARRQSIHSGRMLTGGMLL